MGHLVDLLRQKYPGQDLEYYETMAADLVEAYGDVATALERVSEERTDYPGQRIVQGAVRGIKPVVEAIGDFFAPDEVFPGQQAAAEERRNRFLASLFNPAQAEGGVASPLAVEFGSQIEPEPVAPEPEPQAPVPVLDVEQGALPPVMPVGGEAPGISGLAPSTADYEQAQAQRSFEAQETLENLDDYERGHAGFLQGFFGPATDEALGEGHPADILQNPDDYGNFQPGELGDIPNVLAGALSGYGAGRAVALGLLGRLAPAANAATRTPDGATRASRLSRVALPTTPGQYAAREAIGETPFAAAQALGADSPGEALLYGAVPPLAGAAGGAVAGRALARPGRQISQTAAIRLPGGELLTDETHNAIISKMLMEGRDLGVLERGAQMGYLDTAGDFIDETNAVRLALRTGQLRGMDAAAPNSAAWQEAIRDPRVNSERMADETIEALVDRESGGATVNAVLGNIADRTDIPVRGTAVARQNIVAPIADVNDPQLRTKLVEFIEQNDNYLLENANRFDLGSWIDDDGRLWVEVAERLPQEDALRAGTLANQQGVYNIDAAARNRIAREAYEGARETKFLGHIGQNNRLGLADEYRWEMEDGTVVQALVSEPYESGELVEFKWIGKPFGEEAEGIPPNALGPKAVREIHADLLGEYPDARQVMFERVTGARRGPARAGRDDDASNQLATYLNAITASREVEDITPRMRRLVERYAPPVPEDEFFPTGGTGEILSPAQTLLRNLDIAGPGTSGVGRVATGSIFGGAAGWSQGETPQERARLALAGAIGGGVLGYLAHPSAYKTDRGGFAFVPPVRRGTNGRTVIDTDRLLAEVSDSEMQRLLNDQPTYGAMLHHRFGRQAPTISAEEIAGVRPPGAQRLEARFPGSPVTGEVKRGALEPMPLEDFAQAMRLQFGNELTDDDILKMHKRSFRDYQRLILKNVTDMENMADWDDMLALYGRGVQILDGDLPWYTGVRETVESFLGPDLGEMFIRFLAATSAQTTATLDDLSGNIGLAKRAFTMWVRGQTPRPRGEFGATSLDQAATIMNRVFDAKEISPSSYKGLRVVFGGRKIDNYYRALMGDPDAVVVDIWMARVFGFNLSPNDKLSKTQYDFIEQHIRQMAKDFDVSPVEVQSALWLGIKSQWEEALRTPEDILENYAVTLRRAIGNEPGFVDIAQSRFNTPAAREAARRLKVFIPKAIRGNDEAAQDALQASIELGNQLGIGHVDLIRAFVRMGAGAFGGGIAGGVASEGDPTAIAGGAIGGAALGLGARQLVTRFKRFFTGTSFEGATQREFVDAVVDSRSGVHAPTSGFQVDQPIDLREFLGQVSKFNLQGQTEDVLLAKAEQIVAERGLPDAAQRSVSRAELRRAARELGASYENTPSRRMTGAELLAVKEHISEVTRALDDVIDRLANPHIPADEIPALTRTQDALEQRLGDLLERFNVARSEFGRNLNSLRYHAGRGRRDPAFWYGRAQKELKDQPFTSDIRRKIDELIAEGDPQKIAQYISSLRRVGLGQKIKTIWKAGLLTGPTTHEANLLGNLAMAALETAKDVPAVLYDRIFSLATGQITKGTPWAGARSLTGLGTGRGSSLRKGIRGAIRTAREGFVPGELYAKYDLNFAEVHFGTTTLRGPDQWKKEPVAALLNLYTKGIFRGLLAGDAFFRAQALERSFVDLAEAYASNAGLRGAARRAKIRELLANPPDDMVALAIQDAELATFVNEPSLSFRVFGSQTPGEAGDFQRNVVAGAVDFVVPFKRTPLNVIERAFEASPLGPIARASDVARVFKYAVRGRFKGEALSDLEQSIFYQSQRRLANTLGRSTVGTGTAIWAGYTLASQDLLTGAYPRNDQRMQAKWEQEGRQENSILWDGQWLKLDRISPLGNMMVFGAHMYQEAARMQEGNEEASFMETLFNPSAMLAGAGGGTQSLLQQTFLVNLNDYMTAALGEGYGSAGEQVNQIVANLAGSFVPAAIRRAVAGQDPTLYEAEGIVENVQRNLAPQGIESIGLEALTPKLDNLGQVRRRSSEGWEYLFFPAHKSDDRRQTDDVIRYLSEIDVVIGDRRAMANETEEQFRERLRKEGRLIREAAAQFASNPTFRNLPPEAQKAVVEDEIQNVRRASTAAHKALYITGRERR